MKSPDGFPDPEKPHRVRGWRNGVPGKAPGHPKLKAIRFEASTPYFNDGSACVFSVSEFTFKVEGDNVTGTLTVALAALKTGMSLRDDHMHETLETTKYPTAKLVVEKGLYATGDVPFSGQLTLKADTRPVFGSCKVTSISPAAADCTFKIKLSDYPSIKVPGNVAAKLKDEVVVKATLKAQS